MFYLPWLMKVCRIQNTDNTLWSRIFDVFIKTIFWNFCPCNFCTFFNFFNFCFYDKENRKMRWGLILKWLYDNSKVKGRDTLHKLFPQFTFTLFYILRLFFSLFFFFFFTVIINVILILFFFLLLYLPLFFHFWNLNFSFFLFYV